MLTPLHLGSIRPRSVARVPTFMRPLVESAEQGLDLAPAILDVTRELGFSSFMQGVSLSIRPNAETQSFVYTTLPLEWVALYDSKAYLEVDPRVQHGIESGLPFIWDRVSILEKSPKLDEFLRDAGRYGVCSGVSISMRDPRSRGGIIALSSTEPALSAARRSEIDARLGSIMLLGQYIHELFVGAILDDRFPALARGAPLSRRERQCLQFAANGMTSVDIGIKLGITERTANFHFCNIITKLDVLNRKEAIAKAVSQGIVQVG